ncbi:MAG: prephenate dehydrogenase/arogenate dehydrogenase family protein [Gammaproteobacteria bacterium]|nr:prephenate dehydrogenase/arogenate dehydrogenase family protein [Gammaproteobacteria bacterium]
MIKQLTIIGVGLIGGSLARAAKKNNLVQRVVGVDRNIDQLKKAVELGVIDAYETDIANGVKDAEIVVVAVPLGAMESVFAAMKDHLPADAVISDVGSSKRSVVDAAKKAFGQLPPGFVPGHPIAGTEKSGVEASFAELYEQRCVIITPVETSAQWAVEKLQALWSGCGAEVSSMSAEHHDEVLAATSHLPHVLAFALVDTLGQMHESKEIFKYAAGGFRDFTRIASSDPDVWRDICLANGDALLLTLERYKQELDTLAQAIVAKDAKQVETILRRAKQIRDRHVIR